MKPLKIDKCNSHHDRTENLIRQKTSSPRFLHKRNIHLCRIKFRQYEGEKSSLKELYNVHPMATINSDLMVLNATLSARDFTILIRC